ncbi:MAG: zinc-ribbon domain-containing protein [Clostridiales bacterium]|nr:zinc-ribbon domain-containing protein [Clostridiales bacterium]
MDWLKNFMKGRYGADHLMFVLIVLYWPFTLAARFTQFTWLNYIASILIFTALFRYLSRNIPRRLAENRKLLSIWYAIRRGAVFSEKSKTDQNHRLFTCPGCGQNLRVPAGKGKITIRCPKCSKTFDKNT